MKQVWVIDDDEEMLHAVGLMLKLLDCTVTPFHSVRPAAQKLLSGEKPELFVLDINMPEVSGLDMIEFLRRRPESKNLPIIMLSSEAADTMVDRAMELGADTYVMKPVTIEELEKAMASAFDKHLVS
jgi:two-component system, OmpR family, alkaline phosphatase synthesis response regulator PhoP